MNTINASEETIKPLIDACNLFSDQAVLVVGDVIWDRFVYGSVNRISPESPVPVLALSREDTMLGGAGNAFANLLGLGVKAFLLSVIGDDDTGRSLRKHVQNLGADPSHIITDTDRPTSVKTRFLAGHQQLLRSDSEVIKALSNDIRAQLIAKFDALLPHVQTVILSDYGKGLFFDDTVQALIKKANAANVPVIIDPKGVDFSIYRGAQAITPNRKELSDATQGSPTKSDDDICNAANRIIDDCGIDAVIATRSQDGMSVIQKNAAPFHVQSAQDIEVFDVSGAGDTVIATIAATIATGASLQTASLLANLAGSIAVSKVGTAPIRWTELMDSLRNSNTNARLTPLSNPNEALEQIKRWKAKGYTIGFTNGCFDILHAGHVTYLDEAKNLCDRLIVALNTDSSISILKGSNRPIHDEKARATVLSALKSVDMVVLFGAKESDDDNTASALINAIQPDIYFKGGDSKIDDIPEASTVRTYGGNVSILSNVKGYSTTNAIKKAI